MALILAIEPDRRQAAQLTELVRTRVRADLILAETTEGALGAIGNRVPDLVLVPTLLSPGDDAALAGALRVIATAAHVNMLTIPVLADASAADAKPSGLFARFRRQAPAATSTGCDPAVFADQIKSYLEDAANRAIEDDDDEDIEIEEIETYDTFRRDQREGEDGEDGAVGEEIAAMAHAVVPPVEEEVVAPTYVTSPEPIFEPYVEPVFAVDPVVDEPVVQEPVFEEPLVLPETVLRPVLDDEPPPAPFVEEPIFAVSPVDEPIIRPIVDEPIIRPVVDEPIFAAPVHAEETIETPIFAIERDPHQPSYYEAPPQKAYSQPLESADLQPVAELVRPAEEPAPSMGEEPFVAIEDEPIVDEPIFFVEEPIAPIEQFVAAKVEEPIAPIEEFIAAPIEEPIAPVIEQPATVVEPPMMPVSEESFAAAIEELRFAAFDDEPVAAPERLIAPAHVKKTEPRAPEPVVVPEPIIAPEPIIIPEPIVEPEPIAAAAKIPVIEEPVAPAIEEPVFAAIEEPVVQAIEEPVVYAVEEPVVRSIKKPVEEEEDDPIVRAILNYRPKSLSRTNIKPAAPKAPEPPRPVAPPAAAAPKRPEPPREEPRVAARVTPPAPPKTVAEPVAPAARVAPPPAPPKPVAPPPRPAATPKVAAAIAPKSPFAAKAPAPPAPSAPQAPSGTSTYEQQQMAKPMTQEELDMLYFVESGAEPPKPPTPRRKAAKQKPDWSELIASLRVDVERMKAEGTNPTKRHQQSAVRPAAKPAAPAPARKPSKPTQDQWGLFDPQQCGFAALLAKLDEVAEPARDGSTSRVMSE